MCGAAEGGEGIDVDGAGAVLDEATRTVDGVGNGEVAGAFVPGRGIQVDEVGDRRGGVIENGRRFAVEVQGVAGEGVGVVVEPDGAQGEGVAQVVVGG